MTYTDWWLVGLTVFEIVQLVGVLAIFAGWLAIGDDHRQMRRDLDSLWSKLHQNGPW